MGIEQFKKIACLMMLFGLFAVPSFSAEPTTFVEFASLPASQRYDLVADQTNPSHMKLVRWWWRLHMGESQWQFKEQQRLAAAHGYQAINSFFTQYYNLRQAFLIQTTPEDVSGIAPDKLVTIRENFKREYDKAQDTSAEAVRLSASLSPSPQATSLRQRAEDALSLWFNRYPDGTRWIISQSDMDALEKTERDILTQLQALPKLPPAEEQAEIDALPDDYPNEHGLQIPFK